MNDVVNSLLDDDCIGTAYRQFMGKTDGCLQTIGFVGDAGVLAQNPGTAGGFSDNRCVIVRLGKEKLLQVIRPVLSRDGIAIADNRMVFTGCKNFHIT